MTVTRLRRTIGGSDAAATCGIDPYRSQVAAWLEITGRVTTPETEAMAWGSRIEPLIYATLEADGYELMPAPADGFRDTERPWMTGHPDGFVALNGGGALPEPLTLGAAAFGRSRAPVAAASSVERELGLLEVKTAGAWQRGKWDEAIPVQYVAQVQHYLHLSGLDVALVACLIGGQQLEVRTVHRDERAIGLMLDLEETFWGYVERDQPPPPDGSSSARDALLTLYPHARPDSKYRLTRDEFRALQELRARKEQAKAIDAQIDELENTLRAAMGDAELAVSPHDTDQITYRNVTSHRLDTTALKAARPDVYEEFLTETTTRRFSVA